MRHYAHSRQRGIGLIELLVVLAIVGIIAYLVVGRGTTARENNSANNAISDMQLFVNAVQKARPDKNYASVTAAEICAHLPAANCNRTTNALSHSGGGAVTVADATIGGQSNGRLTFSGYPATACGPAAGAVADAMTEISIGGTAVKNSTTAFTQAAANAACTASPVAVILSFR